MQLQGSHDTVETKEEENQEKSHLTLGNFGLFSRGSSDLLLVLLSGYLSPEKRRRVDTLSFIEALGSFIAALGNFIAALVSFIAANGFGSREPADARSIKIPLDVKLTLPGWPMHYMTRNRRNAGYANIVCSALTKTLRLGCKSSQVGLRVLCLLEWFPTASPLVFGTIYKGARRFTLQLFYYNQTSKEELLHRHVSKKSDGHGVLAIRPIATSARTSCLEYLSILKSSLSPYDIGFLLVVSTQSMASGTPPATSHTISLILAIDSEGGERAQVFSLDGCLT
uniref:Uncharacterized protein n=1 Tax=Timema poppense TaxID=170557 RepID=A0A7R9DH52_TIMPO|nr:unnamed protein product [Timema poppensis]